MKIYTGFKDTKAQRIYQGDILSYKCSGLPTDKAVVKADNTWRGMRLSELALNKYFTVL